MQGAVAYDDPAKDAWRGWKWNAIADAATSWRRLPPSERARQLSQKTVLYLVGPDDHDRRRALARGFANHNLIAVDLVEERVKEVRAAGGLAICGSLQQVIANWPLDWPIDVIDADFCHGFVSDVRALHDILLAQFAMSPTAVISLNMLRGRDANSNGIRDNIEEFLKASGTSLKHPQNMKHRGMNWIFSWLMYVSRMQTYLLNDCQPLIHNGQHYLALCMDCIREQWASCNPRFNSYKSKTSGQVFDSVVHRLAFYLELKPGSDRRELWKESREAGVHFLSRSCVNDEGIRERIAALRAVRTMKMKGA
jgi:hypothetical protein